MVKIFETNELNEKEGAFTNGGAWIVAGLSLLAVPALIGLTILIRSVN